MFDFLSTIAWVLTAFVFYHVIWAFFQANITKFQPVGQHDYAISVDERESKRKSQRDLFEKAQRGELIIIVGAGQSGLAVAACLKERGIPALILEKSSQVGTAWKNRYDRLHLHTTRDHSNLPYMNMPRNFPVFPSRDQVVDYLQGYAKALGLEQSILFNHCVTQIVPQEKGDFTVTVEDLMTKESKTFSPKIVIGCFGENSKPRLPEFPGKDLFKGSIIHSSEFKNGKPYRGQNVVVIGCGNSGCEQAIDLIENEAKSVSLVARSPVNITSRQDIILSEALDIVFPFYRSLPLSILDNFVWAAMKKQYGDMNQFGLLTPNYTKPPVTRTRQYHDPPIIDVGTIDLIRNGHIKVISHEVESFKEDGIQFKGEKFVPCDSVILATGFEFASSYSPYFDESICKRIVNQFGVIDSGKESPVPNLYFIGYNDLFGRFHEVSIEAMNVAKHIQHEKSALLQ